MAISITPAWLVAITAVGSIAFIISVIVLLDVLGVYNLNPTANPTATEAPVPAAPVATEEAPEEEITLEARTIVFEDHDTKAQDVIVSIEGFSGGSSARSVPAGDGETGSGSVEVRANFVSNRNLRTEVLSLGSDDLATNPPLLQLQASESMTGDMTLTLPGTAPGAGDVMVFQPNGTSAFASRDLTGPVTSTGTATSITDGAVNTAAIADSAVTYAKIQNVSANARLLGSGAAGIGLPPAELTLGNNLSMTGTTLSATSAVVQQVRTTSTASQSTNARMPMGTAAPTTSNGAEVTGGSVTITPTNAAHIIVVELMTSIGNLNTQDFGGICIYRPAQSATALAGQVMIVGSGGIQPVALSVSQVAGTTSAITYTVRFGPDNTSNFWAIGRRGFEDTWQNIVKYQITATEYTA